jgi:hypothetical protein
VGKEARRRNAHWKEDQNAYLVAIWTARALLRANIEPMSGRVVKTQNNFALGELLRGRESREICVCGVN